MVQIMVQANPEYDWDTTFRSDILIEVEHFIAEVRLMSAQNVSHLWRRFLAPCFRYCMAQWAGAVATRMGFMRKHQFADNFRDWLRSMTPPQRTAWRAHYRKHHGPLRIKVANHHV